MKKLSLALGLISLLLCVACGSNNGVVGFIPHGPFSNASLNGQYVYQVSGFDFFFNTNGLAYSEAGVFLADGNGHITSGTDDFSEGSGGVSTSAISGSYSINSDGTGQITLSGASKPVTLAITLVSSAKIYLIEADPFANAGGLAEKQDATAIATLPSGTFAFRQHTVSSSQSAANVGVFTLSGGVATGNEDVNRGGVVSSLTFTAGSLNPPDTITGRGTGTLTDSSPLTSSLVYYIVDASNVRFLSMDPGIIGLGRAEKQNGTPALSGSYAFGSKGDTNNFGIGGVNTVGVFTATSGNITAGALDSVLDGTSYNNIGITSAAFSQTSNGRAIVTLPTSSGLGTLHAIIWMVSPSRGFFLINDPNTVQDGTLDLQTVSSFSNSTMNGQFAFNMDGFDVNAQLFRDRVGTLQWDGKNKLTLNEVTNTSGSINSGIVLSGNYQVSSNGRAMGTINSLSLTNGDLVFYLISGSDAYVLQNDTNVEISGAISLQPK